MDADELLRAILRNYAALAESTGDEWDRLCDERVDLMLKVSAYFANKRTAGNSPGGL